MLQPDLSRRLGRAFQRLTDRTVRDRCAELVVDLDESDVLVNPTDLPKMLKTLLAMAE